MLRVDSNTWCSSLYQIPAAMDLSSGGKRSSTSRTERNKHVCHGHM